jgi:hypothetical protein
MLISQALPRFPFSLFSQQEATTLVRWTPLALYPAEEARGMECPCTQLCVTCGRYSLTSLLTSPLATSFLYSWISTGPRVGGEKLSMSQQSVLGAECRCLFRMQCWGPPAPSSSIGERSLVGLKRPERGGQVRDRG